ncbi:MAG TPA: M3 family oligoendopeptidase [Aggregatilineales bacterium]|nr:M3 family oligoendopeptidase [Aggregatilineales bacterium]
MSLSLESDVKHLIGWKWEQIAPYYDDLAARSLMRENVNEWLADWSRLQRLLAETGSRLEIATTRNTADQNAERQYHEYLDSIQPAVESAEQILKQKLLDSRLEVAGFDLQLRKMRAEAALFREANLPLLTEEQKLNTSYNKIIGAQTVIWDGQEITLSRLRPFYRDPDRAVRERAWRLEWERRLQDREALDDIWQQLLKLREQLAANAGLPDYRTYRWQQWHRFDYTPDDCKRFQRAIEAVVVPAASRIYEKQRRQLGLDGIRPWDVDVDPLGRHPLKPFNNVADLERGVAGILQRVDPTLGGYFETMRREGLLDLDNRKNKAPGGYCNWSELEQPFIFMNAVGLHGDVLTLLHESGHSFHNFETRHLPYKQQLRPGREFTEVASTAMELLASPYLTQLAGGFYSEADAARALTEVLEDFILFWPYMAVVDAFQHWVYENVVDAADTDQCNDEWLELMQRFMPGVDRRGLEPWTRIAWQRQLHIFSEPFYYVEYGMSRLCVVQVWRNARRNQAEAVAKYRHALSFGGTLPLPELYTEIGARFAFDEETLGEAVSLIESTLADLEVAQQQ